MSHPDSRPGSRLRSAALLLLLAPPLLAVTPVTPQKTGGKVTVNGKPLGVNHAYLFHAPDNWEEGQVNPVVLISPRPLETAKLKHCLLYTSPSPRDRTRSRMPSSA